MRSNMLRTAFWSMVFCLSYKYAETNHNREHRCSILEDLCNLKYPKWNAAKEHCLGNCIWSNGLDNFFTENGRTVWEGDMILSADQVNQFYKTQRKARKNLDYRWPSGIVPFVISQDSEEDRTVIQAAMNHWTENTCVKFEEVPQNSNFSHVVFIKDDGCYSTVGRDFKKGGAQELSIGKGCAHMGTIAHEIGHALGFLHEHCRRDRDEHLKILYQNVNDNLHSNFVFRHDINSYGVPYDLASVMQYNAKEFTMNGNNTIVTVDPWKQFDIGQRDKLSFLDIKLAILMYNCTENCTTRPMCRNDGFVNKDCQCTCPPPYSGSFCEIQERSMGGKSCRGEILTETEIKTPNYPNHYDIGNCIWWIKSPGNKRINFTFLDFDLFPRNRFNPGCRYDYIEIRNEHLLEGEHFCENPDAMIGRSFLSKANDMILLFTAKFGDHRGFIGSVRFF